MDLFFPIIGLIGIWFLVVTIPGPNFIAVTQYSISESRVEGFFISLGVSKGAGIWATASLLGLGVFLWQLFLPWHLFGGMLLPLSSSFVFRLFGTVLWRSFSPFKKCGLFITDQRNFLIALRGRFC